MPGIVLIIDDEPEMAELVRDWLEELGADVVGTTSYDDAVAWASGQAPRVILLDISLGDEDGLRLLPLLQAVPGLLEVPIVMFSVHNSRRGEALALGAAGFIRKPFEGRELLATLRPFLG